VLVRDGARACEIGRRERVARGNESQRHLTPG
jgi:hypothetical protein